jgi:arsenate reductase
MRKIYHYSNCSTCKKVIKALNEDGSFEVQDIKSNPISEEQLDDLKEKVGSYEALFSRRAMKYRSMGLADTEVGEEDYRELMLGEFTFLKRPVTVIGNNVFSGGSKSVIEACLRQL